MCDDRNPTTLSDEDARKLADEFGRVENEALQLFNEVRPRLLRQIKDYFASTGLRSIEGETYTVTGTDTAFWYFADRPRAVAILASGGLLETVFEPENAALAFILDDPDLPMDIREELEKLAERRIVMKVSVKDDY